MEDPEEDSETVLDCAVDELSDADTVLVDELVVVDAVPEVDELVVDTVLEVDELVVVDIVLEVDELVVVETVLDRVVDELVELDDVLEVDELVELDDVLEVDELSGSEAVLDVLSDSEIVLVDCAESDCSAVELLFSTSPLSEDELSELSLMLVTDPAPLSEDGVLLSGLFLKRKYPPTHNAASTIAPTIINKGKRRRFAASLSSLPSLTVTAKGSEVCGILSDSM